MKNTPSIGTWLSAGSPVIADLAAMCGLDWALLDLEHGSESEAALPGQLRALGRGRTQGIVRPATADAGVIARVLDWGARGIMVPHVNSAAEAEHVVQAAHYAPRGHRGYSRTVRAYDYGLRRPEDSPPPLIMAQIETIEAVRHAGQIAGVDGIGVLFVGPSDLQFDLKARALTAFDFAQCLERVVLAARGAGKEAGILVRDPADVPRHIDLGFTRIAIDSDLAILRKAWQETVTRFQPRGS